MMKRLDLTSRAGRYVPSGPRRFSLEQANRALVLVKRIVADVVRQYARMLDLQEIIDATYASGDRRQHEQYHRRIVTVAEKLQTCAEELDDVGVVLQDWSQGIVCFPWTLEEREVCLSWRLGEEKVEYWHEADGSFAERQRVQNIPSRQTVAATS